MKSRIFLSKIFLSKNAEEIEIMVVVVVASYAISSPRIGPVLLANFMVEVHPHPGEALSDSAREVDFAGFAKLVAGLSLFLGAGGRIL